MPIEKKVILCNLRWFLQFNREGVLLLRGLDSRLSKDLPSDLQKLRCKVLQGFVLSKDCFIQTLELACSICVACGLT